MTSSTKNSANSDSSSNKKNKKKIVSKSSLPKKTIFYSDTNQTQFLVKAGKLVSEQAIREAKALGLEIMYIENGIMYREQDGKREVVSNLEDAKSKKNKIFKKGVTLYVKK